MIDYIRVPTSAEVWAAIRARHPELRVYGRACVPDGDPSKGKTFTSYCFKLGVYPVIEAETTWEIDQEFPLTHKNERHKYWLCIPVKPCAWKGKNDGNQTNN